MSRARLYIRQTFPGWWTDEALAGLVGQRTTVTVGEGVYAALVPTGEATVIAATLIERTAAGPHGDAYTTVMLGFDYADDEPEAPTELEVKVHTLTPDDPGASTRGGWLHVRDDDGCAWKLLGWTGDDGVTL